MQGEKVRIQHFLNETTLVLRARDVGKRGNKAVNLLFNAVIPFAF